MTVVRPNSIAGINSITVQTGQALNIHNASGNLIRSLTSSSGVSTYQALHVGAGTTTNTQGISVGTGCSIVSDDVNTLEFYTNSSERLRITSAGLVGINTTSPEGTLSVDGSIAVSSSSDTVTPSGYDIKIRSTTSKLGIHCVTADGTPILEFGTGGSTGCCIFNADATPMRLGTVNTERMRIRGDGRISIGSSLAVTGVCTAAQFLPTEVQTTNRNMVINGDMQVSQRGSQVTGLTASAYATVDRFKFIGSAGGTYTCDTVSDSVDNGLRKAFKFTCTTADNAGQNNLANADGLIGCEYRFEGQDVQRIQKGFSSAKQVTLSFWVKSNLTGTYNVELKDNDNSRNCGFNYTVSSSGTWEKKIITFPADTTGTMDNDNNQSLTIQWWLAAGNNYRTGGSAQTTWGSTTKNKRAYNNVSLSKATSNYWQITGVQLEVGAAATPFEHRSYADELLKCQRYYQNTTDGGCGVGVCNGTAAGSRIQMDLKTTMRANPTVSKFGSDNIYVFDGSAAVQVSTISQTYGTPHSVEWEFTALAAGDPLTSGRPIIGYINGSAGGLQMSSEL